MWLYCVAQLQIWMGSWDWKKPGTLWSLRLGEAVLRRWRYFPYWGRDKGHQNPQNHIKSLGIYSIYTYFRSTPRPVTVTTRIITYLVGNPYKPSFATVTGWGVDPTHTVWIHISNKHVAGKKRCGQLSSDENTGYLWMLKGTELPNYMTVSGWWAILELAVN